ncbi:MAG: peptidase S8 [Proteobacteria bacterium]|nr:peptidase S8 [Pseudomonadota bacterium]
MKLHPLFVVGLLSSFNAFALEPNQSTSELNQALDSMSAQELDRLLDVRNAKGESIFIRRRDSRNQEQAGIWATLDPVKDGIEGTSTEELYQKFRIPRRKNPVIVAVIDSGVDIHHEDLKGKIWVNEAELNGKPGVDDDGDGYVDDIYGWNFLGAKDGRNVDATTLEVTRVYEMLRRKSTQGPAITSTEPAVIEAKATVRKLFEKGRGSEFVAQAIERFQTALKFHYNPDFNSSAIVGDDPENLNEIGYGNNDVTGPDPLHGTHVAGIIAADRDNRIGIRGQGRNLRIMSIRAVPNGDERDKDVANAIRFAVDHGARVVNMSFGKPLSPGKSAVDAAVKYAESKGVLLVHAAGNDGLSLDHDHSNFPTRKIRESTGTREATNWIEVGASDRALDSTLPAIFSNYGGKTVDLFAPGVKIMSTLPGNQYAALNGTSMATPEVAGVAALLLEKVPTTSFLDVRNAILSSVRSHAGLQCRSPDKSGGAPRMVDFRELSITGGTLNALGAMEWLTRH